METSHAAPDAGDHAGEGRGLALAVRVDGLAKSYRSGGHPPVPAVDGVDLGVRVGELLVLLGPSGCGKTTLLRCIAGLETPDAGEILIGGRRVFSAANRVGLPPEERRIGMMFQSYALWPHMTVFENVAYPLTSLSREARRDVRAKVQDVLSRLGVAGFDHRYPSELSGGQQQRVALARALVASPSVILFDEPLSNVDARVRRRLRAQLRELKQQTRFAGIYVTHDQEEAMELADTLAVMDHGRIRQIAPGREVYNRPASLYVAGFVGEINRWAGQVEAVEGSSAQVSTGLGTLRLALERAGVGPGDQGWVVIRPERVKLLRAGAPGVPAEDEPRLRGTVRESTHFGARCEVLVDVSGQQVMVWMFDVDSSCSYPEPGETVEVLPESASLRWLPE
ncbi:MAG: ABC transporter ATP-binding protein [Burkholderiales bacterium]|nr:ABC transporter ATP-binding protein [Burkholderiales bacterium]